MRHVCEPLSLNELEEAFDRQAMDIGLINIIEFCDKLSACCDNRLLKYRDLLVLGECSTGLAPVPGCTCIGLGAYRVVSWSANRTETSKGGCLTLGHIMACMVSSPIAHAIRLFYW